MHQGVIANFKKYYTRHVYKQALNAVEGDANMTLTEFWKEFNIRICIEHIDVAWREVSHTTVNSIWKALCPQFANNLQEFQQDENNKILENLVEIFKSWTLTWKKRTSKSCSSHAHKN